MMARIRGISPWVIAAGVALVLGAPPSALAKKGPKISVGDDPSLKQGSPEVVIVEVSDFQCPYCARGVQEVMAKVYEKYVKTGKVELIYLDLPLQMHPHAFKAAEAAACAGDQNMFWDMHDLLFGNQNALAPDRLPGYAEELGLDVAAFNKCLSGGKKGPGIREDVRTAQNLGISGTPAYVLGRRIPGGDKVEVAEVLKGLRKYEEVEGKIDALLTQE